MGPGAAALSGPLCVPCRLPRPPPFRLFGFVSASSLAFLVGVFSLETRLSPDLYCELAGVRAGRPQARRGTGWPGETRGVPGQDCSDDAERLRHFLKL